MKVKYYKIVLTVITVREQNRLHSVRGAEGGCCLGFSLEHNTCRKSLTHLLVCSYFPLPFFLLHFSFLSFFEKHFDPR